MTKKHYESIAAILKKEYQDAMYRYSEDHDDQPLIEDITKQLADYFEQDNPKFNRTRFLQACGIEQSNKKEYLDCEVCGEPNEIVRDIKGNIVPEWCIYCKN